MPSVGPGPHTASKVPEAQHFIRTSGCQPTPSSSRRGSDLIGISIRLLTKRSSPKSSSSVGLSVFGPGLAQDVCVRATALDAIKAGFETHVISEATRPVTEEGGRMALVEMRQAGVLLSPFEV